MKRDEPFELKLSCTAATLMKFHASRSKVRVILGPFSSGKSFAVATELFLLSLDMPPCKDGVRRTGILFARENATLIRDSMMKTWIKLFPEDENKVLPYRSWVCWHPPMGIRMRFPHPSNDGTDVDINIYCRHQGSPEDAENLKGVEISHVWIDEANRVPKTCVTASIGRMGREPDKDNLRVDPVTGLSPTPRFCAFLTSNMPHEKHWLWENKLNPPSEWEYFIQPPAFFYEGKTKDGKRRYVPNTGQKLSKGILPAENIENLNEGWGYYVSQLNCMPHEQALVLVCAQPGHVVDGLPVYGGYSAERHYAGKKIPFDITKTLFLGFDWGFWPTCVFAQINDLGQLCYIDMIDGEGVRMGIEQLWKTHLRAKLINEYRFGAGAQIIAVCDPAVGSSQTNLDNCLEFIARQGINIMPCATNLLRPRIDSVDHFLRSTVGDGLPALQIGADAYKLHEGMNAYYVLKAKESATGTQYSEEPVKDEWSHAQDAAQYIAHMIKNPVLYDVDWRNKGSAGYDGAGYVQPAVNVGAAGVV